MLFQSIFPSQCSSPLIPQLISVSAQYSRATAKLIETLDNELKMFAAPVNFNKCVKMRQNCVHLNKGEQKWFCTCAQTNFMYPTPFFTYAYVCIAF